MKSDKQPPGDGQQRVMWFALTMLAVAVTIAIGAGFIWGIGKILNLLSPVLWPLAIAMVLAYLLDPGVSWLQRHGIKRTWGILIVFAALFCVLGGLVASVVPQMVKETNKLAGKIPGYTAQAQQRLIDWANRTEKAAATLPPVTNSPPATNSAPVTNPAPVKIKTPILTNSTATNNPDTNSTPVEISKNVHEIHNQIVASATDWTAKILAKFGAWLLAQLAKVTALVDVIVALILIPIYAFYFLREKEWIRTHWTNYLPIRDSKVKDEVVFIIVAINQYMIAFFRGQVLVSLCSGVLYTIGFACLGLDYSYLLGFLCMLLTMIPFLGPMISCIISVALTAMQFGDWFHPLITFLIFAVVVSLENFFYSPRIMGTRVGMHPAVIIVAVMVGITLLGGLLGGVLAIPLAAALRVMMVRYLWKKPKEAEAKLP
jgi:predicted PurR-regulated permease PerM